MCGLRYSSGSSISSTKRRRFDASSFSMPITSCRPPSAAAQWCSARGGWKSCATSAAPSPVAGATSVRRRRFAGRNRTGGAPARFRFSVSGGRASRKIVRPRSICASRWMRSPEETRETSSIVGGGAAASSSVQIAVRTVDFPLDASPTSAHIERGSKASSLAARYPPIQMRLSGGTRCLWCPQRPEIHGGIARLPPAQEALDRRMQDDVVELRTVEQTMAADRGVARRRRFEGPAGEIAGEDDVDNMLGNERALRGDRVHDRDRPLDRDLVLDAYLLAQLPVQRVGEALARVDAAAGQEPVVAATGLLVLAEQDPLLPPQHCRYPDARLERHHTADEPNPRTPRSLSGSSSTSIGSTSGTCSTTSCAIRIPCSTTNGSRASVLRRMTFSSPRYPESTRPGVFTIVIPWRRASPERGCTKPAKPSGIATARPVPTVARSPGPSSTRSHAVRSRPASPLYARAGTTASSRRRWMGSSITRR